MKRSKIFLRVTTCLLAIAGVAAAKRFGPAISRYYYTLGPVPKACLRTSIITCVSDPTGPFVCTFYFVTTILGGHFNVPVYTRNNCTSLLRYSIEN
jgi:hypothetical protein